MATAEQLRAEFQAYLDEHGLKYQVEDKEDNRVFLQFGREKYDTWALVDFDEEGDQANSAHISSIRYAKVSNLAAAMVKVNEANKQYRWVKTYIDEEGYVSSDMDAYVFAGSVGEEITRLTINMAQITERILVDLEGVATHDESFEQAVLISALREALSS